MIECAAQLRTMLPSIDMARVDKFVEGCASNFAPHLAALGGVGASV